MAFRSTGLRVLEDTEGALLISDGGWKTSAGMSFSLTLEMLERAAGSDREAAMMFKQFSSFILKHRAIRKEKASQHAEG